MVASDALTALAPLVGGGGVASIIVAWLGYRRSAMSGGKPATIGRDATLAIGTLYADRDVLERVAIVGERLILSVDGLSGKVETLGTIGDKIENGIDETRALRRAVQDFAEVLARRRKG
jgi:hypothetical protein